MTLSCVSDWREGEQHTLLTSCKADGNITICVGVTVETAEGQHTLLASCKADGNSTICVGVTVETAEGHHTLLWPAAKQTATAPSVWA
jgi:hypothetical protein